MAQEPPVDELVARIIEMRGQVEDLDAELQRLKAEHSTRMSTLSRQAGQLAAEREQQELRLRRIEMRLEREREQVAAAGAGDATLAPVVEQAIAELRAHVAESLPFQRADRLQVLDGLQSQLRGGALEPSRVANRLWALIADEIRLSGEVGLYRQPVTIDGDDRLADVVRIGMMQLYFRTDDERFGYAARRDGEWAFEYADGADRDRIRELTAALRQQIRSGYFELPNPGTE